ncbi:tryptophan--tRNA ligase [Candidatus Falkowbacteria bacterium CG10_big_fil_rev_8_21_14_0_10_43_11]|uniref:Tryptophan--tRNA ligase n=1 Tax=Candidatus Falkowbacteria bacterium CG10_big_fil_rev_8_21_14_0_10_43_11 TaxID=1974568 RepID=A0A2M6WMY1_9BACT|nr:MAG: tryptophan--tRNA ligase [Candidatus Falkowbacteria bacterium CG10_big_fil_rev_8_21_14_0_10_43_11]
MNKVIFSGVQPSGNLHLGNYLGALKNWVALQNEYQCVFCVVDYHAITVKQEPKILREKILEIAKLYLAAGINPETAVIFQQSRVSAHTELAWILNTITKIAELERMTQFKDKAREHKENINLGLFDYPVLMAADILLYDTDLVPVGDDQTQHVELTRVLARRFNQQFAEVFKIPEPYIQKQGARIMGLDNPAKKMSKSAGSELNYIALLDKPETARKKIMKAVTDSGSDIKFDPKNKPAISNLLIIYSLLAEASVKELEARYNGRGPAYASATAGKYGEFKRDLAEVAAKFLEDFQQKYNSFDDKFIEDVLEKGKIRAEAIAEETLKKVKKAVGLA